MEHGYVTDVRNPFRLRAERLLDEIAVKDKQEPVTIKIPLKPTTEEITEWHKQRKEVKSNDKETVHEDTGSEEGRSQQRDVYPDDSTAEQEPTGDRDMDTPADRKRTGREGSRYSRS